MERLTYRGSEIMTEDGLIRPSYSDYPTRRIIERLAEYEDLEEQGLLLRLNKKQCNNIEIGDVVRCTDKDNETYTFYGIILTVGFDDYYYMLTTEFIVPQKITKSFYEIKQTGKHIDIESIFSQLIKEAEQRLKEMESE